MMSPINFLIACCIVFVIGILVGIEVSSIIPSFGFAQGYFIGVFLGACVMGISVLTSRRFQWVKS